MNINKTTLENVIAIAQLIKSISYYEKEWTAVHKILLSVVIKDLTVFELEECIELLEAMGRLKLKLSDTNTACTVIVEINSDFNRLTR